MKKRRGFEQGPIRPPSEARSLLLRLTRNCPWNRCTFCSVYKGLPFSLRPAEEVIREIDVLAHYAGEFQSGRPDPELVDPADGYARQVARNWVAEGMESIFLQDADSLILKPEETVRILSHLRDRFPRVERITSYARSQTIARISLEHLRKMADAGLNRIHIGMETASNRILGMVRKGASKGVHIEAGVKTKEAGIELSEYVLAGIGGEEFWREHAIETADAMNQINPDFIRFRTLHIRDTLDLYENSRDFTWQRPGDHTIAREILLFLENLGEITSTVKSDHMYNLFMEIDGTLPEEKGRLTAVPRRFLDLEPMEQACYQVGKRMGCFWQLSDLQIPGRLEEVKDLCARSGITPENVDVRINELVQERLKSGMI